MIQEDVMIPITTASRYNAMVNLRQGKISREIFSSRDIYEEELEKVFTRAWLFVGHESQIPNPGDFFTSRMGGESVILARDKKKKVHVFLNSCRHRGMKVCQYDHGNTQLFTCPYHSWSFTTDGKLFGVPQFKTLYEGCMDKEEWSLIEVPKMETYKGTVWASWDKDAPDLMTYLGDARAHLDLALDCRDGREGGSEVLVGVHKWIIPCNWKFAAENFLGDTYHNVSHRSVDLIGIGPSAEAGVKGRRDNEMDKAQHVWVNYPAGHGVHSAIMPEGWEYTNTYQNNPIVAEYFQHCHEERRRRLGEDRYRLVPFVGTIYPQRVVPWQPAAQPVCLAPPRPRVHRGLALLPGGCRCAAGGEGFSAHVLHAVLGARRHDRTRRHGKLELRHRGQPRCDCQALSLQLPAVTGQGAHRWPGGGQCQPAGERGESPPVLPALA
jgi:phenylpropionate dioxygenase-like ring-hydroxylating dioxygenase large terminal subunit